MATATIGRMTLASFWYAGLESISTCKSEQKEEKEEKEENATIREALRWFS